MATVETLSPELQELVDTRLDSIERVLFCTNVDRSERREIVQAVEDQVYEMLARENTEPTRDSVLAVLGRTDPPEAYLLPRQGRQHRSDVADGASLPAVNVPGQPRKITPLAIISCVLGILSLLSLILWPVSAITGIAATVCGSIALTQIYYSDQLRGAWLSIIGVSAPAVAMLTLFVLVNF